MCGEPVQSSAILGNQPKQGREAQWDNQAQMKAIHLTSGWRYKLISSQVMVTTISKERLTQKSLFFPRHWLNPTMELHQASYHPQTPRLTKH